MNTTIASAFIGLLTASALCAADSTPSTQVSDAITKLKTTPNYSWTVTTVAPPDAQFTPPPVKGQTESAGFARFTSQFGDNTLDVVLKGNKAAVKGDDGWKLAVPSGGFNPEMFALNLSRNGPPSEEVERIVKGVAELKTLDGGAFGGDLTTDSATDLLTFGPHRTTANADPGFPGPKNVKGSTKIWLKDSALVKYQTHLTGTVTFDNNDTVLDFTKTTEIQNVGTTKLDIPDEAKKQFDAASPAK